MIDDFAINGVFSKTLFLFDEQYGHSCPMDRFEELHTFVTVVDAGSFTAAADSLGVARSVVSRRVVELEERLGVQLLRRTTRRMNLTDSGRAFHQQARRILDDLAEAENRLAQAHGELRGTLRVALPMSFSLRHLSPAITEFCNTHPGIRFDLDFNDRRVDLLDEGFDLALRIGRLADSSALARRLFDARTVVCASPAYLERRGRPETIADLADHVALVYSNVATPDRWSYLDENGETASVRMAVALSANSGEYLCDAAIAGLGMALQPTFIAHRHVLRGELVPVLTDVRWPVSPAFALYPPTRHLSYRVRAFIDFLAARFAGTPYWDADIATWLARGPG